MFVSCDNWSINIEDGSWNAFLELRMYFESQTKKNLGIFQDCKNIVTADFQSYNVKLQYTLIFPH